MSDGNDALLPWMGRGQPTREARIEAMARAMYESERHDEGAERVWPEWDAVNPSVQLRYRNFARVALEALEAL